jgi:hypothetical protein
VFVRFYSSRALWEKIRGRHERFAPSSSQGIAGFLFEARCEGKLHGTNGGFVLANLKTAIVVRGLKQADLAQTLKIPPTVLSEIIHGRRHADASLRARVATALRADEGWLFDSFARIPARGVSMVTVGT